MTTLDISAVSVGYGRNRIIQNLTLPPIGAGQVTVLIGPNGAGKSTLLKSIAHILPFHGEIGFAGQSLRGLSGTERAKLIGFMPQALPSSSELTALECALVSLHAAHTGDDRELTAMEVFDRLDILNLALRPLDRLSGGERQLVGLAQAIVADPQLVLLDEPTSALDLARQFQVMSHARALAREGRAVVAVLHDLALAAQWADQVIILKSGRLHDAGTPGRVITSDMLADVYGLRARIVLSEDGMMIVPENLTRHR